MLTRREAMIGGLLIVATGGFSQAAGFNDAVVNAQGQLIFQSIRSPNYKPGVRGWSIFKNGNVEFNNGVFRGTVTAGTFQGTDFIINSAGEFFYSSTPALGNLIASSASIAGSDQFGNAYLSGDCVYSNGSLGPLAGQLSTLADSVLEPALSVWTAVTPAGPWTLKGSLYLDINGGVNVTKNFSVTGAITATGGTVSAPSLITTDTWNAIPLTATWTALGGDTAPEYRQNAIGMFDVKGDILFTSTGVGLSGSNSFSTAIPAAYRPATSQFFPAYVIGGSDVPVITANRSPMVQLTTAGVFVLLNVSSTGTATHTVQFGFKGSYQVAD